MDKTFQEVLPAETAQLFANALDFVIDNDMPSGFEFYDTTIKKDKYFKVIIAPFKANEYLVIMRDITDLKEAQNEIANKARKLELSNKELEEFAYVVSHDLKQPTKTIVSYLQLLKKNMQRHLQLKPTSLLIILLRAQIKWLCLLAIFSTTHVWNRT